MSKRSLTLSTAEPVLSSGPFSEVGTQGAGSTKSDGVDFVDLRLRWAVHVDLAGRPEDENGTWSVADDFLRNASHQQMRQPGPAVSRHDDEIRACGPDRFEDDFRQTVPDLR